MRATFFGLEIGKTGLHTSQFGLDATGHNIANLDTPGYTRQRAVQTAYDPYNSIGRFAPVNGGGGMVGGGTRVMILDQIRSAYLDRRFRTESQVFSYWETRAQRLSYIESYFDNVNEATSINSSMADFFGAMSILAEDPIAGAPRILLRSTGLDMVQQLNMMYQGLIDLQRNENNVVATKVKEVNGIAEKIADLNKQIYVFEVTGMIANDLRDKRNLLVDQLAELVDVTYEEYPDPTNPRFDMFRVSVAGVTLVDHEYFGELCLTEKENPIPGEDPLWDVRWVEYDLLSGKKTEGALLDWSKIEGGQIKAHIDIRDGNECRIAAVDGMGVSDIYVLEPTSDSRYRGIPYYIEMVNSLARALVKEVNEIHRQGWSDNPLGSETNINFFTEEPEWVTWIGPGGAEYRWNPDAIAPGEGAWAHWDPAGVDPDTGLATGWWLPGGGYITQNELGQYVDAGGTVLPFADAEYDYSSDPPAVTTPPAGFYRYLDVSQITAKNISVSWEITDNEYNIACSSKMIDRAASDGPEFTQRHNNENIKAMYAIFGRTDITSIRVDGNGKQNKKDVGSFADFGSAIRFDVGDTLKTAYDTGETCRLLTLAADNQRTAVAGVSLDEEMTGLVKYQHAYNGAARVITAMDDALDRLINGTGRVGL